MGLVKRVYEVCSTGGEFVLLKTQPVKIVLQENAQHCAAHTTHRVPIPLTKPVKKELERMEANGITEVTEPTEQCPPMVPSSKNSGKVCICVDLKRLNKAEIHPAKQRRKSQLN
ncbi:hypothetical protein AAFF_G00318260 [Aldrovandia affinis]|uniref:Uncharacterized protein n=1 Tax=Aldrovandia affinis TaxID=143900 RepID=A0AAD7SMS6_9TELE|nr:hypothetical protein AAFF_G00318260 [Aldrovandia affinis]